MTHIIKHFGKAMTAIAAVLAFQATQSFAQDTSTPPEPVAETSAQTPETADPLAPEPAAEQSTPTTDAAVPPAPKPKVETTRATPQRAKPASSNTAARSTARRVSATAPAAVTAAPAAQAAAPAPLAAEPQPAAAVEPVPPPVAEPAPAANDGLNMQPSDLLADDMLPVTGAVALGLIALAGAGIAMHRRKRRREDEEFEARQQALAEIESEPALELGPDEEVRPGPVFTRSPAPMHDPVPDKSGLVTTRAVAAPANIPVRSNWESRPNANFMIRPADKHAKRPVEQD